MLETIREYARELLDAEGRQRGPRSATDAGASLRDDRPAECHAFTASDVFGMVEEEHANLRAALERALTSGESGVARSGCRCALAVLGHPGHWSEGRRRLDAALSARRRRGRRRALDALHRERPARDLAIGRSRRRAGASEELLAARASTLRAFGPRRTRCTLVGIVANVAPGTRRSPSAARGGAAARARSGRPAPRVDVLNNLGDVALQRDEFERAAAPLRESWRRARPRRTSRLESARESAPRRRSASATAIAPGALAASDRPRGGAIGYRDGS